MLLLAHPVGATAFAFGCIPNICSVPLLRTPHTLTPSRHTCKVHHYGPPCGPVTFSPLVWENYCLRGGGSVCLFIYQKSSSCYSTFDISRTIYSLLLPGQPASLEVPTQPVQLGSANWSRPQKLFKTKRSTPISVPAGRRPLATCLHTTVHNRPQFCFTPSRLVTSQCLLRTMMERSFQRSSSRFWVSKHDPPTIMYFGNLLSSRVVFPMVSAAIANASSEAPSYQTGPLDSSLVFPCLDSSVACPASNLQVNPTLTRGSRIATMKPCDV